MVIANFREKTRSYYYYEKSTSLLSDSKSTKRIFVSYARADSQQAKRLYKDLKQAGANRWINTEDLIGGNFGSRK